MRSSAGRRPGIAVAVLVAMLGVLAALPTASPAAAPTLWTGCVGGAGDLSCSIAYGVAADPNPPGHVYIADLANGRITEYTAFGDLVKTWGWDVVQSGPGDDTTAPEDQFEICVPANGDTCKDGLFGSGAGQLGTPVGAAVDGSGNVYVVDFDNRRVQKFDSAGNFVLMFGGEVNKTKTENPLATTAEKNLCTAASGDVCQAGTFGTEDGQFGNWALGNYIVADRAAPNRIYVGDFQRIQIFTQAGAYLGKVPDPKGVIARGAVQSLAKGPGNNLFLSSSVFFDPLPGVYRLDSATGLEPEGTSCPADVENPRAIASVPGTLYVFDQGSAEGGSDLLQFTSNCTTKGEPLVEDEALNSTGLAAGTACLTSGADVYLSNTGISSTSPAFLRAYGPPPNKPECPRPVRPPEIVAQYALSVDTDGATLGADINPRFFTDATYQLQYGTAACIDTPEGFGAPCAITQPASPTALGGGKADEAVSVSRFVGGLEPDTTYRYRFLAQSGGGGPVLGATRTFLTYPPAPEPKTDCPNQAFRTGKSAKLPECRAYEMVSPVDKANGDIATPEGISGRDVDLPQSAASVPEEGPGFAYASKQAFGDALSSSGLTQYLASRGKEGWSSHALDARRSSGSFLGLGIGGFTLNIQSFSADLRYGWFRRDADPPLDDCVPAGSLTLYRRDNADDSYRALHCGATGGEFQGASADSTHGFFRSTRQLTADALPRDPIFPFFQLYEWVESLGGEGLRLVSVLPDGTPCAQESSAGTDSGKFDDGFWHLVAGAVSADGERIYWSCDERLYLRSGGEGPSAPVSGLVSAGTAQFWAASADGSQALFSTGDLENGGATLYRYDAESGTADEVATEFRGLLGASSDAGRAYLVSEADLDGAGNGTEGQPNLYLHEAEAGGGPGEFTFVGPLSGDDASASARIAPSPVHLSPVKHLARVTPDGLSAAFTSNSPELAELAAGYDNTDRVSGEPDSEVYLYDAAAGELHCPSCNRGGARPTGRELELLSGAGLVRFWVSARIVPSAYQTYAQRALSDDGRHLFFESYTPLLPRDTNGRQDVYEWQPAEGEAECTELGAELFVANASGAGGCLSLISSGESHADSDFADASADGSDVFFKTHESLLPQDPGLRDVYDARVGGGFPPPTPPPPPCEGEACQSPPAPPAVPTPASATTEVDGNVTKPKRCPKGKRKVKRKGKVRCVGKRRAPKAAKRGRAAR